MVAFAIPVSRVCGDAAAVLTDSRDSDFLFLPADAEGKSPEDTHRCGVGSVSCLSMLVPRDLWKICIWDIAQGGYATHLVKAGCLLPQDEP